MADTKAKFYHILEILWDTDEEHPKTAAQIGELLDTRYGIAAERKSIPSLDDKTSVNPYVARADARFLHNNMDYAITATFDFNCQMSPREKIRGSIFKPTARRIFDRSSSSVLQKR